MLRSMACTTVNPKKSQNSLLIRNGTIVNADGISENDIFIENGIIKELGKNLSVPNGIRSIDAKGFFILPGGVDPHTHLEFEFMGTVTADDFYHGTKAAVAGGTTTIIDFMDGKENETLIDAYNSYREKAEGKVCCDYGFHMVIKGWNERIKADMETLCSEHGINSFKMFMAYSFRLNDSQLYSILEHIRNLGALAQIHAENGTIIDKNTERLLEKGITGPEGHELSRPEEVEAEAVNRVCVISKQVSCPVYIVHVMSKLAAQTLADCRKRGAQVFGETLASALGLDGSQLPHKCFEEAAGCLMSPPIRPDPTTPRFLMDFLKQGNLQVVGSDNCTFNKEQKKIGMGDFSKIPNGINGLQDRMSVVWEKGVHTGILSPTDFVAVTSTNAAKIFNIYPRKGCIAVGSDADLVVWNPTKTRVISAKTHQHAVDFNIFEGMECHGVPEYVIVNGRVCVDQGQLNIIKGSGRYLECPVFCPYVYKQ
ncbi:dihydropyrimidinase-like [Agrilus planipennis]|uniref:dihydropyrimidinase n=1 Tax=Agrilus planipennis TaxID=224129 RepID=A0A1W4WVI2_AGRPL|nr:dihydropyrimidinase-like [Agrilus planipennis]